MRDIYTRCLQDAHCYVDTFRHFRYGSSCCIWRRCHPADGREAAAVVLAHLLPVEARRPAVEGTRGQRVVRVRRAELEEAFLVRGQGPEPSLLGGLAHPAPEPREARAALRRFAHTLDEGRGEADPRGITLEEERAPVPERARDAQRR